MPADDDQAETLEQWKLKRNASKGQMTRLETWITSLGPQASLTQINAQLTRLDKIEKGFETKQTEIEAIEGRGDEDPERVSFEDRVLNATTRLMEFRQLLCPSGNTTILNDTVPSNLSVEVCSTPALAPIELPHFSGDYSEYPSFIATFDNLVHDNNSRGMTEVRKLAHLRSACKGKAFDAIKHLPITSESYDVAREILEERFHKKRLIFEAYISRLWEAPKATSPRNMRSVSDLFDAQWKALTNITDTRSIGEGLLIHLALRKCDNDTIRRWEERSAESNDIPKWKDFSTFLKQRCTTLECIEYTTQPHAPTGVPDKSAQKTPRLGNRHVNAADAASTPCSCCAGECTTLSDCSAFRSQDVKTRFTLCRDKKICYKCLKPKPHTECEAISCNKCNKSHNTLLHFDDIDEFKRLTKANQHRVNFVEDAGNTLVGNKVTSQTPVHDSVTKDPERHDFDAMYTWLATAMIRVRDIDGNGIQLRALLDAGSQLTIISTKAQQMLALPVLHTSLKITGVTGESTTITKAVKLNICDENESVEFKTTAAVHRKLDQQHPQLQFQTRDWEMPVGVQLADPHFNRPRSIDLLLGADVFYDLVDEGRISLGPGKPCLHNTKLGWVVVGSMTRQRPNDSCNLTSFSASASNYRHEMELDWMRTCWELEHLQQPKPKSAVERACEQHFHNTVKRNQHGRYIVRLPFYKPADLLGQSRQLAVNRLKGIEKKMQRSPDFAAVYSAFMSEYEQLGHMSEIEPPSEDEPHYYISHFGVWNHNSTTTQFRVVFDASCPTSSGYSLNDLLMVGPTIQPELVNHLIKQRFHKIVLCGDISKMYRQILVSPADRKFQLIVWRRPGETQIRTFQLNTVTYGTASAPYQAIAAVTALAKKEEILRIGAAVIESSLYVDDMMTGGETDAEVIQIYSEVKTLLPKGCFHIRKFQTNSAIVMAQIPEEERGTSIRVGNNDVIKTLGLNWNPTPDTFTYYYEEEKCVKETKRSVLSKASRLFDPLGLLQPVTIRAKILIQQLWALKSDWDEPLTQAEFTAWQLLEEDFHRVEDISIPRYVLGGPKISDVQLHGFADASMKAYAAAVYVRTISDEGSTTVQLLMAKTRVAPLKTVSIARLELCATLLLAELFVKIKEAMPIVASRTYCWTDSMTVLKWVTGSPHLWETFVANRVTKIQELTATYEHRHVPGKMNPADLASRGVDVEQLTPDSIWFVGPPFLCQDESIWPAISELPDEVPETKAKMALTAISDPDLVTSCKYQSWTQLRRIFGYVNRFLFKTGRHLNTTYTVTKQWEPLQVAPPDLLSPIGTIVVLDRQVPKVSVAELQQGEVIATKVLQASMYASEIKLLRQQRTVPPQHHLASLKPFLDDQGIMRVGGRLMNSPDLSYEEKFPILLSKDHILTKSLFIWTHSKYLHAGPKALLATIHRRYWVPRGKVLANQVLHGCVICVRSRPVTYKQVMGSLPQERVTMTGRPFLTVGCDLAGPFHVHFKGRGSRPVIVYMVAFVCFSTKAVHLELVDDLTTAAFLDCLKRFIARRGLPREIWSDNATNFVGASRQLAAAKVLFSSKTHWESVYEWCRDHQGITWRFIPPRSPHFGGLWEAAIKSAKHHIIRVAGAASLTRNELETLIVSVEAILNSRPLIPISTVPGDGIPLTPAHFLVGSPLTELPEPDLVSSDASLLQRYERVVALRQQFWRTWSREYLCQLQQRYKWREDQPNPQENDVVLLVQKNVPAHQWQLGRIVSLSFGDDGKVRVLQVKTASGIYKRGITEVCPLPVTQPTTHN